MDYLKALKLIHDRVKPTFYLEIGCWRGSSLELAQCPRLAIDPAPEISMPLTWPTRILHETSDAFFARPDTRTILGQSPELAFIDGMHLVEYLLRDFINVEKHAAADTIILIDDVVPGDIAWASRDRQTQAWTGDVYRIIPLLRHYRPDLDITVFDTTIAQFGKGLAVIANLDPKNTVLAEAYDTILADLETGGFCENTTEDIRSQLQVCSAEQLQAHIDTLVRPAQPSPAQSSPDATALSERYLELAKAALTNELYREDEFRLLYLRRCLAGEAQFDRAAYLDLKAHDPEGFGRFNAACHEGRPFENKLTNLAFTHTMMGRLRLDSLHHGLDLVRKNNIPGDVMECGVWRGGGCILMAAYLKAHEMSGRKILVADSFQGLPVPSHEKDAGLDLSKDLFPELAIPLATVQANFAAYGLLSDAVVFLKGWFCDTLPTAPTSQLALLRLDGDLYESTMDALVNLYDYVAPGGIVIIDDWGVLPVCRAAVKDFFAARDEQVPEITKIDWTGVYFTKPALPQKG